jgi:hypothetical protein
MELQEIQDNIRSRRNKVFLHMEEVRDCDSVYTLCFKEIVYLYPGLKEFSSNPLHGK